MGFKTLWLIEGLSARLVAEDGERAMQRVRAALEGESFTVKEDAQLEPN